VKRRTVSRRTLVKAAGLGALAAGAGAFAREQGQALARTAAVASSSASAAADKGGARRVGLPETMKGLGDPVGASPYGRPSRHEADVVRRVIDWMNPTRESTVSFTPLHALEGIITPNGLHFERHHAGAPDIAPEDHRLLVHGLVERPMVFSLEDLRRFPRQSRFHFLECAGNGALEWRAPQNNALQFTHGMIACCQWTGVRLMDVLEECGLKKDAAWLLCESVDGAGYARSLPLEKAREALLVFAQNGEALRPEQGYPLRLLCPGLEGAASVKWLGRIEVGDAPWMTREETARYSDLLPDGRARLFTLEMEVKSVITHPCPENPLRRKGPQQLSGLAWSGRGRIVAVDVSFDGGMNWQPAHLEEPVLPRCLTRFRLPFEWHGEERLLQSRAVDETGAVQPTHAQNVADKGETGIYHNNSITTWQVMKDGTVRHVRLG